MADHGVSNRNLDARPDRMDFRDLPYRPPLVSLPEVFPSPYEIEEFLDLYLEGNRIRDQGSEGACTGFGLATVIDYIYWDRMIREQRAEKHSQGKTDDAVAAAAAARKPPGPEPVSPYMLYDIAKIYDEWEGEEYSGSSCRGALKGWHKHGVCNARLWRNAPNSRKPPSAEWRGDAARRPLGAYYRVNARSISDLQAAIFEVRAVYCSARVHAGWDTENLIYDEDLSIAGFSVPYIPKMSTRLGGHAFAIVGYNQDGFIVQNSWGRGWGHEGFAVLTYEDWAENGNDAWVAALAAPMRIDPDAIPRSRTATPLAATAAMARVMATAKDTGPGEEPDDTPAPWTPDRAYDHSIVLGNDGLLLRRRIDAADALDNMRMVAFDGPLQAARNGAKKLMIFAHGGLNSEAMAIERAMRMGPWMERNGIYPIFIVWRTSLLESLSHIDQDFVARFRRERAELRAEALGAALDNTIAKLQNAFDKAFEVAAERVVGKPVWGQIKQNAAAAANQDGGTRALFETLRELHSALAGEGLTLEPHVVGHSAGAILLGHMLDDFDPDAPVGSATLLAPACTMQFAARYYGRALERGVVPEGGLHIHALSDENERRDTVGPYGKSLLYLISRALETPRKQPLLGLARCMDAGNAKLAAIAHGKDAKKKRAELMEIKALFEGHFADSTLKHIRDWRQIARTHDVGVTIAKEREFLIKQHRFMDDRGELREDPVKAPATHGAFDNSLTVMNAVMARILGVDAPPVPIEDLTGF